MKTSVHEIIRRWGCLRLVGFLGLNVMLFGCIERDDHFILNPDGSGKVLHQAKFVMVDLNMGGREKSVEDKAKDAVRMLISDSAGVDAWKDVMYSLEPDGRVAVQGVAYFSDLSQLKLKHGGAELDLLKPDYQVESGQGRLVLEWSGKDKSASDKQKTGEAVDVSRLTAERAKYQQAKPMMAAMFGNMKINQKFTLPADIKSVSNLKQEGRDVEIQMAGSDLIQSFEAFISDDEWLLGQLEAGKSIGKDFSPDASLNEKLFGASDEIQATTLGGGEAQFDYHVEMEAARDAMPAMMEALGFSSSSAMAGVMPAAAGEGFATLSVGGVRLVKDVGNDQVRPFNWNPGLSISLTGTFGGSVLEVKEGKITQADTIEGERLLMESEFDNQIRFANLSDDGTITTFEVNLRAPQSASRGIQGLAGTLEYHTSTSTREVDLGLNSLATGTKSTELGAVIGDYTENQWGGKKTYQATLDLDVSVGQVKEVRFLDEAGELLQDVRKSGHSGFNDSVSMNFSSETPFPDKGNIIVVLHDGLEKYQIPFEIGPFDWLGMPITDSE